MKLNIINPRDEILFSRKMEISKRPSDEIAEQDIPNQLADLQKEYFQKQQQYFKIFSEQQNQKTGDLDNSVKSELGESHSTKKYKQDENSKSQIDTHTSFSQAQINGESRMSKVEVGKSNKTINICNVPDSQAANTEGESFRSGQLLSFSPSYRTVTPLQKRQQNIKKSLLFSPNNSFHQDDNGQKARESTKRKITQIDQIQSTQQFDRKVDVVQDSKILWQKKWFKIMFYINKVRKLAVQSSMFFHPQRLNKLQVNLIGDKASDLIYNTDQKSVQEISEILPFTLLDKYISYRTYRKIIKFITSNFSWLFSLIFKIAQVYHYLITHILNFIPLFHYLSSLYILWEIIIFLCTTFLFLYIPFEYSFLDSRGTYFQYFISIGCPIIYGLDIFIRANTKSTESGDFIDNHIKIFHKYLQSDMIPDIVSLISLNLHLWNFQGLYFLFFIRITRSFRVIHLFREQFLLNIRISGIISLFILLTELLYYAHVVSCIWYGIGQYELTYNMGWIVKYNVGDKPIEVQYLWSFYYSVITMTTIGYGDITPQTDYEKLIVIGIAFVSCCIFGYSINFIGNILSDFKLKNDIYLQEVAKINKYFHQYKVDLDLQAQSRQYLDIIYSDKREEMISSIDTLSNLSDYLQKEIKVNVFTKRLKKVQFFNNIFSVDTLEQIAIFMSEKIYSPDEDIINISINQQPMLYIVHSGAVKKYAHKSEKSRSHEIKTIYEGGIFGFNRFMTGNYNSDFNYKSVGICSVLQIPLGQFLEAVKMNQEDFEKFSYAKDQFIFNQNFGSANLSCESCWQKFHGLSNCPFIFYEGKKEQILRQYFREINEKIKSFKRSIPNQCFNAKLNLKHIQLSIEYFQNSQLDISETNTQLNSDEIEGHTYGGNGDQAQELVDEFVYPAFQQGDRQNDKASQREITSNKYIIDPSEQVNVANLNSLHNKDKSQRVSLVKVQSTLNKFAFGEEGYAIIDGVLCSTQKGISNIEAPQNDSSKRSWSDAQQKNNSDIENQESLKNLSPPKVFKKNDNSFILKKLNSLNDQLIRKQETQNETLQYRSQLSQDPSREQKSISKLINGINRSSLTQTQSKLNYDKPISNKRQSLDNRTIVIDKANLSLLLKSLPQLTQIMEEEQMIQPKVSELFMYRFDMIKVFIFYFPSQNYEDIIEKYNVKQKVSIKNTYQKKYQKNIKKNI